MSARHSDVEAARYAFGRLRAQFPQLALDVLDVRFAQLLKPNRLNHLHEADKSGLQRRRQSLDFSVYDIEGFDRPLHPCYIADAL